MQADGRLNWRFTFVASKNAARKGGARARYRESPLTATSRDDTFFELFPFVNVCPSSLRSSMQPRWTHERERNDGRSDAAARSPSHVVLRD